MTTAEQLPTAVTVRVPAKVNLELKVGPLREDDYHDLATVFIAVGLYDEVSVTEWDQWQVVPAGPYADLIPTGEDNLVVKAAQLVMAHAGIVEQPLSIRVDKEIPVAAGMAGGSADAAAALVACDQLFGLGLDRDTFHNLAAQLGSDVPFLLNGGIAVGSGRGTDIAPVLARGTYHFVIVTVDGGLSTPKVYAECDRLREGQAVPEPVPSPEVLAALRAGDARLLGAAWENDLAAAALSLRPDLRDILDAGVEFGALGGIVSGSGPTCVFVTDDHEGALDLSVALAANGIGGDVKIAKAPVHGAQVVAGPRSL